jgi:hypothetical protein
MPLFMDVHNIEGGVSAADVAGAHKADLEAQGAHSELPAAGSTNGPAGSSAWSSRPTPRPHGPP